MLNQEVYFKLISYLINTESSGSIELTNQLVDMNLPIQVMYDFNLKTVRFDPTIDSVVFDLCFDYFTKYKELVTKSILTSSIETSLEWSREEKAELIEYIENCCEFPGKPEEFQWCLSELLKFYQKNKILETTLTATKELENGSAEALEYLKSSLNLIPETFTEKSVDAIKAITGTEMLQELLVHVSNETEIIKPKAYFGWRSWDETVGGLYEEELTLIAGKPSGGKSFFVGEIVFYNAFVKKKKVVYSTNENTKKQFEIRMLSRLSNIPLEKIRKNLLTDKERAFLKELLNDYLKDELRNLIIIPPLSAQTVDSIKRHTELLLDEAPDLHVVDHLTKLKANVKGVSDWREKEYTCDQLKTLGQEHNCPVISPIHISREGAKNDIIKLSDVQYQSYIQLADNIWVLNDHKDHPSLPPVNGEFEGTPGIIIATVERARTVPIGTEKYLVTNFSTAAVSEPSASQMLELASPKKANVEQKEETPDELEQEFQELFDNFGETK